MSAERKPDPAPWTTYAEILHEDPEFPVVLAKARAKARGEAYKPEVHGPHGPATPPSQQERQRVEMERADAEAAFHDLLERFRARGRAPNRHLRAVPSSADRSSVRRVREL